MNFTAIVAVSRGKKKSELDSVAPETLERRELAERFGSFGFRLQPSMGAKEHFSAVTISLAGN